MQIKIDPKLLTPPITQREIEFCIHCFSKEYRGNDRTVAHRITEMSPAEWQAARDMLREHDEAKVKH